MESSNQFLGTERIGKLMQKYAIPCIISLLVGALYNIVDQMSGSVTYCLDEYACNFTGKIRSGDDLVWYGRVETERHYKGDDRVAKQRQKPE